MFMNSGFTAAVVAACLTVLGWTAAVAAPEGSRYNAKYFTNHPVVSHTGETYRLYDDLIKDRIVIISFIYLNCNDICPLTTARLAEVVKRLGDTVGRDIFIYSITMDPENDTPELLNAYAEAFGAGNGWLFLTGKPADLKSIRWKLGERSRTLAEHRNHIILGNDRTGEWSRSSIYADLDRVASIIRQLDPDWQHSSHKDRNTLANMKSGRVDNRPGQALFQKACATCHSIGGGDRVGPDLRNVTLRRNREWLTRFMMAPDRMRKMGDRLALELSARFNGVSMPNLGLAKNDVADLLEYISDRSRDQVLSGSAANDQ